MSFVFSQEDIERFAQKIVLQCGPLETECWIWRGAKSRGQGNTQWYGSFSVGDKVVRAHKFSFVAIYRQVWIAGMHLDHLCENSLCVNPWHLEMVPREINQARKGRSFRYDCRH